MKGDWAVGSNRWAVRSRQWAARRSSLAEPLTLSLCFLRPAFQLLTAHSTLPTAFCLLLIVHCTLLTARAQLVPKPNSPLYGTRTETASASSGLPKALREVGIDQHLNQQLPLDLAFRDESGQTVSLGQYFGKRPVVLALVYYECPMLCTQVLNGMATAFRVMAFTPGTEYDVVTVSFDPRETAALAASKRNLYVNSLPEAKRASAINGWHFLTGDETNIKRLAAAVGFRYYWDESTSQFAHASGIMIATPEGKLSQYYYGIEYSARDLRLGLIEASANKIGSPVDQLLLFCYHYDPATGKYGVVMKTIRIAGAVTVLGIIGLLFLLHRVTVMKTRWPAEGAV